jgi:hypothetical protein
MPGPWPNGKAGGGLGERLPHQVRKSLLTQKCVPAGIAVLKVLSRRSLDFGVESSI